MAVWGGGKQEEEEEEEEEEGEVGPCSEGPWVQRGKGEGQEGRQRRELGQQLEEQKGKTPSALRNKGRSCGVRTIRLLRC